MLRITQRRDLHTGRPVWLDYNHRIPPGAALRRNLRTDVLIVGAGISGILCAHELSKHQIDVVVVDRRGALRGSTAASTALLQFELDVPLVSLQRRIGVTAARTVWRRSLGALQGLQAAAEGAGLGAALHMRPSIYLSGPDLDARAMRTECAARERAGLPSRYLTRKELFLEFGLRRPAALVSESNLITDPLRLAAGLLRAAMRRGVRLYAPVEVVEVAPAARHVRVSTAAGRKIEASQVIFCTGYELPKIVSAAHHHVTSTWAIATAPQPHNLWPRQALIWEAATPYLYLRATDDGRVICGGEDEPDGDAGRRDAKIEAKARVLERRLRQLLPQLDTRAAQAWAGSFGQSKHGMPTIGAIPGYSNCYAVLGFGGNGITFSMLAAQLICAEIARRPDPDAWLFEF